jgi:hypothetical protein
MQRVLLVVLALAACGPSTRGGGSPDGGQPLPDGGQQTNQCRVVDDDNGVPDCTQTAPPLAFEPEVQWSWPGADGNIYVYASPLVGNLSDDDQDGDIDLCDVPDVVVVATANPGNPGPGTIYLLDGRDGHVVRRFDTPVDFTITPAIGDIDGDGLMELVTLGNDRAFMAFEHDGTVKWIGPASLPGDVFGAAIVLADLDEDGDVEIISAGTVVDHTGQHVWTAPVAAGTASATTAVNLDGQPGLEVVMGHAAYHADGSPYYLAPSVLPGFPQVADLDGDGLPEVLVTNRNGISILEHDGGVKILDARPTGVASGFNNWIRPAVIHDFDGDGTPELAVSSASAYSVFRPDMSIVWSAPVADQSGIAGGTAFDFLGDGSAEAMYADEHTMFVFDGAGQPLLSIPRASGTLIEYPVVADVDDDGSAEIVVVSNIYPEQPLSPAVQVIRDREDRWIQARRIWNQHAYHVTNVREDGTIPQHQVPSWTRLNTFRSNAQIGQDGVCQPPID